MWTIPDAPVIVFQEGGQETLALRRRGRESAWIRVGHDHPLEPLNEKEWKSGGGSIRVDMCVGLSLQVEELLGRKSKVTELSGRLNLYACRNMWKLSYGMFRMSS